MSLSEYVMEQVKSDNPDFENISGETRVHDWRSHVGGMIASRWPHIPIDLRIAFAMDAQDKADAEEWD